MAAMISSLFAHLKLQEMKLETTIGECFSATFGGSVDRGIPAVAEYILIGCSIAAFIGQMISERGYDSTERYAIECAMKESGAKAAGISHDWKLFPPCMSFMIDQSSGQGQR